MEFRVLHVLHFSAWPRCRKQKRRILLLAHFVAMLVRDRRTSSANSAGQCGGIGVRDDCGAVGARDDVGSTGMGLRAGAVIGRGGGGAGIFARISTSAASSLAISRVT